MGTVLIPFSIFTTNVDFTEPSTTYSITPSWTGLKLRMSFFSS